MESIRNYYQINIKPIIHEMKNNFFPELNLCIVLFISLLVLNITFITYHINISNENLIAGDYTYHVIFYNITEDQLHEIINSKDKYSLSRDGSFNIVDIIEHKKPSESRYDIKIRLLTIPSSFYESDIIVVLNSFMQEYQYYLAGTDKAVTYEITPLYYKEAKYRFSTFMYYLVDQATLKNSTFSIKTIMDIDVPFLEKPFMGLDPNLISEVTFRYTRVFCFNIAAIIIILFYLFKIELQKNKFSFAIYTTFGAGSRKLRKLLTTKGVLLLFISIIPAYLISNILCFIIYSIIGQPFHFTIIPIFISPLIISLIIFILSKYIIQKNINLPIVKQLNAEDNTAYVLSPKSSNNFLGNKFVLKYGLLHLKRFVKYYIEYYFIVIICGAIILTLGLFAMISRHEYVSIKPQYNINFDYLMQYDTYENNVYPELIMIDEISKILAIIDTSADDVLSHIVLIDKNGSENKLNSNVRYICAGESIISKLSDKKYTGNLSDVLDKSNGVIISASTNVIKKYKINPGDLIYIAYPEKVLKSIPSYYSGNQLCEERLSSYEFSYKNCEITALCEQNNNSDNIYVYFNKNLYDKYVGTFKAGTLNMHLKLPETANPNFTIESAKYKSNYYTESVSIICADEKVFDNITSEVYIDGDFYDEKYGEDTVAIVLSPSNAESIQWRVGDTIEIGTSGSVKLAYKNPPENLTKLSDRLYFLNYKYKKYIIGTIIYDDSVSGINILMNTTIYHTLTGRSVGYKTAEIYVDSVLGKNETEKLWNELRLWSDSYYGVYINNNDTLAKQEKLSMYNLPAVFILLSVLYFIAMSIILYSMNRYFNDKREDEVEIMSVYGGSLKYVKKCYQIGPLFCAYAISSMYILSAFVLWTLLVKKYVYDIINVNIVLISILIIIIISLNIIIYTSQKSSLTRHLANDIWGYKK